MTNTESLQWDADTVMEQIHMQESRHMQMSALVSYQLQYPDMTIREFFTMASEEIRRARGRGFILRMIIFLSLLLIVAILIIFLNYYNPNN